MDVKCQSNCDRQATKFWRRRRGWIYIVDDDSGAGVWALCEQHHILGDWERITHDEYVVELIHRS